LIREQERKLALMAIHSTTAASGFLRVREFAGRPEIVANQIGLWLMTGQRAATSCAFIRLG